MPKQKRREKMKVLRIVSFLLILSFVIAACAPAATPTPAETAAPQTGSMPDLGGREITVAVENAYPPFNSVDENGNGIGWDYDAFTEICKRLNCVPVFTEAAWDGIFEATAAGQYDVVADGVTITDERKKTVAFSDPYMKINQIILVRADETRFNDSQSLTDQTDLTVATQLGTTNEAVAIDLVGESRVKSFEQFDGPVLALLSGDADAVVIDEQAGLGFMQINEGKMKMLDERLTSEELGFVYKQGSDLIAPIDAALAAMKADGTLATLYAKWWPQP
jgi:polar amino acid transport system substrate-binding protein